MNAEKSYLVSDQILIREFFREAQSLLHKLDLIVQNFDSQNSNKYFDEAFRVIHNIKGASMTVGLDELSQIAHQTEEFLLEDQNVQTVLLNFKASANEIISKLEVDDKKLTSIDKNINSIMLNLKSIVNTVSDKLNKKIKFDINCIDMDLSSQKILLIETSLMHILRNACDHGIENFQTRSLMKKEAVGIIQMNIYKDFESLVIEVSDDGAGIDLIGADENELIFEPFFSTKLIPTEISGRGVGLDIVKHNIQRLGGWVKVKSVKGEGSTFSIKFPLENDVLAA